MEPWSIEAHLNLNLLADIYKIALNGVLPHPWDQSTDKWGRKFTDWHWRRPYHSPRRGALYSPACMHANYHQLITNLTSGPYVSGPMCKIGSNDDALENLIHLSRTMVSVGERNMHVMINRLTNVHLSGWLKSTQKQGERGSTVFGGYIQCNVGGQIQIDSVNLPWFMHQPWLHVSAHTY